MNVLDLFSGIGGFSLGLERAGMRTVAFCEREPYARAVLKRHWPDVPQYDDVCTLTAARLAADGIRVDAICGGFPCQDISYAGDGAGLAGERSGLWTEYARIIGELRPRVVVVENVAALLGRGLGAVLGDLAAIGYDAEWHCIPAAAVGAPHRRDRVWIVAYPRSEQHEGGCPAVSRQIAEELLGSAMADAAGDRWAKRGARDSDSDAPAQGRECQPSGSDATGCPQAVADPDSQRLEGQRPHGHQEGREGPILGSAGLCDRASYGPRWWATEPDVGRVADGVPSRVDKLRCLGNAVVPRIPEIIGRAVLNADRESSST